MRDGGETLSRRAVNILTDMAAGGETSGCVHRAGMFAGGTPGLCAWFSGSMFPFRGTLPRLECYPRVMVKEELAYTLFESGRSLLADGEAERAAAVLKRALSLEPGRGSILEELGRACFMSGKYEEASRWFEEALEVNPAGDYAHYCLGLCYRKLGKYVDAGGHFKMARALRPCEQYGSRAGGPGPARGAGDDG